MVLNELKALGKTLKWNFIKAFIFTKCEAIFALRLQSLTFLISKINEMGLSL